MREIGITDRKKKKEKETVTPFIKDSIFSLYNDSYGNNKTIYIFKPLGNTSYPQQNSYICHVF